MSGDLIHLEQAFDDNLHTLRGQAVHATVDQPGMELRQGLRIECALPLWSDALLPGIRPTLSADRQDALAIHPWHTTDAVATNSLKSAIDTAPDTAYGSSVVVSEYLSTTAALRSDRLTCPIAQPAKRRSPISS